MKNKRQSVTSTPYDDVFRTLVNDCEKLLFPLLNEAFGKNYTGNEKIIQHPNEHFVNQQGGRSTKRITDSSFSVIDSEGHKTNFIIESQSTPDNTMIIRIFEYAAQVALDSAVLENNKLKVTIPHASIIFLRSNASTPNEMEIEIDTSGGSVKFNVPILKMKKYSLREIFDKDLYFLLPFYIFNMEKDFASYEADARKLKNLKKEYSNFVAGIDEAVDKSKISVYYRRVILDMSKKVLEGIAKKYRKIRKGVNEVMGGRVLEHEGKTILNQGIAQGIAIGESRGIAIGETRGIAIGESRGIAIGETRGIAIGETRGIAIGEAQGRREANLEIAKRLRDRGMDKEEIHQLTDLSMDEIKLLYKK